MSYDGNTIAVASEVMIPSESIDWTMREINWTMNERNDTFGVYQRAGKGREFQGSFHYKAKNDFGKRGDLEFVADGNWFIAVCIGSELDIFF